MSRGDPLVSRCTAQRWALQILQVAAIPVNGKLPRRCDCWEDEVEIVCSFMQTITGWHLAWWPLPRICDSQLSLNTIYFSSFSFFSSFFPGLLFTTVQPQTPSFFFFLTRCTGSGVWAVMWLFVWIQLPVFAIGWFFFERALVSRVMGNGGTTSLVPAAAPPSPFPPPHSGIALSLFFCRSVSSTGCGGSGSLHEHSTHRQTVAGLFHSSPF